MLLLALGIVTATLSVILISVQIMATGGSTSQKTEIIPRRKRRMESTILALLSSIGNMRRTKEPTMRDLMTSAGNPFSFSPTELLGLQPVLAILLCAVSFVATRNMGIAIGAVAVGWSYPVIALNDKKRSRQTSIRESLPFVLDLLSICMEAGLNFDSSLVRVIEVMKEGPLRQELSLALKEMRMGQQRRDALLTLAKRVGIPEMSALVSTLVQADQLGTGMASALPASAEHLRTKRILSAESAASKAPIKMLFPLVVLIFPCLLILLFGPMILDGAFKF